MAHKHFPLTEEEQFDRELRTNRPLSPTTEKKLVELLGNKTVVARLQQHLARDRGDLTLFEHVLAFVDEPTLDVECVGKALKALCVGDRDMKQRWAQEARRLNLLAKENA
jgi:hypothetical protein